MDSYSSVFWDKVLRSINIFMFCSSTDVLGIHNLQKRTRTFEIEKQLKNLCCSDHLLSKSYFQHFGRFHRQSQTHCSFKAAVSGYAKIASGTHTCT
jgi:hypothetical protein